MASPPLPPSSPPCAICSKPLALPEVGQVPSDLAFKLLKVAMEWHLNTECQEAFNLAFGKQPVTGLLKARR